MRLTRTISMAAAAVLGLAATAASAQSGGYYGGLHHFDWEVDHSDVAELESSGIRALGGYMLHPNLGVEVHAASGGSDDLEFPVGSGVTEEATAELNKVLSIFARPTLPVPLLEDRVSVFGLAGYTYGKIDILAENARATVTENGFSWGAGAEVAVIPNRLYVTADYVEYLNASDLDASAMSLGLRLSFTGQ